MSNKDKKDVRSTLDDVLSDSSSDDLNKLSINKEFKEEYEKRKERQEMARAREMGINLDEDEEDMSSEDEGQELTYKKEAEILNLIQMIKNHDPKIHNKDFKPFEHFNDEDEESTTKKSKGASDKLTAKDMLREQVLSGKIEDSDSDSDSMEEEKEMPKTFAQEMSDLKNEVLEGIKKEEYP